MFDKKCFVNFGHLHRNLVGPDSGYQTDRIPATWPEWPGSGLLAEFQRFWQFSASMPKSGHSGPDFGNFGRNSVFLPEFGHFCRNLYNPDSDEIVRIPAFILDSGYSS
jgi:hypothetical protein